MIERQDVTPVVEPKAELVVRSDANKPKLNNALKMKVLAMIARGERIKTIQRILKEEYGITYSANSVSALRKKHGDTIREMGLMILDAEVAESEQIRVKALRQLNRKIDNAQEDETEAEFTRQQYLDGAISYEDYQNKMRSLTKLTVNQLLAISKEMYNQNGSKKGAGVNGGIPVGVVDETVEGGNPQYVQALLDAIKRGDTISMKQLDITPNNDA